MLQILLLLLGLSIFGHLIFNERNDLSDKIADAILYVIAVVSIIWGVTY